MTQANLLYQYLKSNYKENEPIFLSEIQLPDMKPVSVRQQLKKLTEDGRVKRFATGIYFIPRKTLFRSGSTLSVESVIKRKYLTEGSDKCGYICGMLLANQIGLTTQVPMVYEITTNKATTEYRETQLGKFRVVIKRPYVPVTEQNANILQFLDLMKEVVDISELEGKELTQRLIEFMRVKGIRFGELVPYLSYYPEKIYKNMYEVGLLNGVLA